MDKNTSAVAYSSTRQLPTASPSMKELRHEQSCWFYMQTSYRGEKTPKWFALAGSNHRTRSNHLTSRVFIWFTDQTLEFRSIVICLISFFLPFWFRATPPDRTFCQVPNTIWFRHLIVPCYNIKQLKSLFQSSFFISLELAPNQIRTLSGGKYGRKYFGSFYRRKKFTFFRFVILLAN